MSQIIPSNTFVFSNFIVSANVGQGNFTTIQSAVNAASSGDTIFIADGVYNEAVTLKPGISITAWSSDSYSSNVKITGGFSYSGTGDVYISNICFSSDNITSINYSGSASGSMNFINCLFICSVNVSIVYSNSSSSSSLALYNCILNDSTNANTPLVSSSPGFIYLYDSLIGNNALNVNPIVISNTTFQANNSQIFLGISFSSCNAILNYCNFFSLATSINAVSSTNCIFNYCSFQGTNSVMFNIFSGDNTSSALLNHCTFNSLAAPNIGSNLNIYYTSISSLTANSITFGPANLTALPISLGLVSVFTLAVANSITTNPVASQSSSLALGSAYQNTLGYDVILTVYIAVSAATSGSILSGVGPTNTPTQQTIVSSLTLGALNIIPVTVYLPYNYYALISTSGTISASISGQQVTPV